MKEDWTLSFAYKKRGFRLTFFMHCTNHYMGLLKYGTRAGKKEKKNISETFFLMWKIKMKTKKNMEEKVSHVIAIIFRFYVFYYTIDTMDIEINLYRMKHTLYYVHHCMKFW